MKGSFSLLLIFCGCFVALPAIASDGGNRYPEAEAENEIPSGKSIKINIINTDSIPDCAPISDTSSDTDSIPDSAPISDTSSDTDSISDTDTPILPKDEVGIAPEDNSKTSYESNMSDIFSLSAGIDGFSSTAHIKTKYLRNVRQLDADWVSHFTVISPEFDGNKSNSYNNGISYKVGTSLIKPIKVSDSGNNLYLQAGINYLSESVSSNRYDSENLVRASYRNGYNYATIGALYEVNNNFVVYHRSEISTGNDTYKNGAYHSRRFGSHGVFGVGFEWNETHSPEKINTLELNGHERFKARNGLYFNYVQPYQHNIGSPADGINTYSFALDPQNHQPSGTCNFSRIDNATLTGVNASVGVSGGDTYVSFGVSKRFGGAPKKKDNKVVIYPGYYNVLRIMSGMGGLAYSN